jgi:septal ring factor EnvC (AmiA/AmiB activator)
MRAARRRTLAAFSGALLACLLLPAVGADDRDAELARVRARLQTLQAELNVTRTRRDSVREQIDDLERGIAQSLTRLRVTEKQLRLEEQRLRTLRERAGAQRQQLEAQRESLARQVRAQYAAGRQEQIKLLLNQQDPGTAARVLTYYRYVHQARAERIGSIQTALAELAETEAQVRDKQEQLAALRETEQRTTSQLEADRRRRGVLLASLDRKVASQSQELERLREDEARLTRLLKEVASAYAEIPLPRTIKGAFGTLRGKLALPAQGRLSARFGDAKPVGNLKWRGLLLTAAEGAPVRAVARGRVAYADWLRGFGLLLILEHGDGYMTLYGHNQSLHKQAGEWAEAGETIARVGTTGDAPQAGLYFEIRHHGEPRDPLLWCRLR